MAGTPIPTLFFGRADTSADVLQANVGATDGAGPSQTPPGDAIAALFRSARFFPAGFEGEATFTKFWVGLTADVDDITLRLTPIVDEVVYDGTGGNADLRQTVQIQETLGTRVVQTYEFQLWKPYDGASAGSVRNALRGSWWQLLVETVGGIGTTGTTIVDAVELEFEIVRESTPAS